MLHSLRLRNFRCYQELSWNIPSEGAILLGDNAQGKSSLLEALCFALSLHSPRASRLERLARHGEKDFGLSLSTDEGKRRILWQERKLRVSVNGQERRDYAAYLADAPPVAWLGNGDIALVSGPAEERRRYLDFLGCQWHPGYREALQAYRKALKSRNALLRNPRRRRDVLNSYGGIMAEHGQRLMELRRQLLQLLSPHIAHSHAAISGREERIELQYRASACADLAAELEARLALDEHAGFCGVGPHRDDFLLFIQGAAAADFASEGQQRSLATALQLAHSSLLQVETGHAPILLIDDIFGELDPRRRKALLEELPRDAQVFISTTHLDWLGQEAAPLPLLHIRGARLYS